MKLLLEGIIKALVDWPEEVRVTEVIGERALVFEVRVASQDVAKVIGRRGAHAEAMRTLLSAIGGKHKKRYVLDIVER